MEYEQRNELNNELNKRSMLKTMGRGLLSIKDNKKKRYILIFEILVELMVWYMRGFIELYLTNGNRYLPFTILFNVAVACILITIIFVTIYIFGNPINAKEIEKNLRRIHFVNDANEVPLLIGFSVDENNKDVMILEFETYGIPLTLWKDKTAALESAIDCNILDIYEGKNKRRIIVEAISSKVKLPDFVEWNDGICSDEEFKVAIGQGLMGHVYWDMAIVPHALIGGGTGSGKTVLLKCIIHQCIMKGAQVYLADFKGGVDFGQSWKSRIEIINDKDEFRKRLALLNDILEHRKDVFSGINCNDIIAFNKKSVKKMPRIILACDELAEVMDKTGVDQEEKKFISENIRLLARIASQGRAFGIHLVLGTQRPDANIVEGQIKSNINFRICGRADDILSRIVLDNTSASDIIPRKAQGRFITGDGTTVQSYYYSEV